MEKRKEKKRKEKKKERKKERKKSQNTTHKCTCKKKLYLKVHRLTCVELLTLISRSSLYFSWRSVHSVLQRGENSWSNFGH